MNVLVTGGAGYIGSHAAKALNQAGYTPIVYDNLSRGNSWAVRWGPLVRGDIGDIALLKATLQEYNVQAIMHFAAFAYVGESMSQPGIYFENNSVASLRLIQAAQQLRVQHIVFSSSCATYGSPKVLPIREDHPQHPINPYGESKLFVESVLRWFGEAHKLNWVALRYFNAAGADPQLDIGECHQPETHLIPLVLEAASDPQHAIELFGTDYPTPDGTAVRDYIHVSDLADAHVRALDYLLRGGASKAFNLGSEKGTSVAEVIDCVRTVTGLQPRVLRRARRPGDPAVLIADAALANKHLGWIPHRSDLKQIVSSAWKWRKLLDRQLSGKAASA